MANKVDPNVCIEAIIKAGKGALTREHAKDLIKHFTKLSEQEGLSNVEDALSSSAKDLALKAEIGAARQIKTQLLQRKALNDRIADANRDGFKVPSEGILAKLAGVMGEAEGSRNSTDYKVKALTLTELGRLHVAFEKEKLDHLFYSDKFQFETMQELEQLRMGKDGKGGVSGVPQAKRMAEIIHETMSGIMERENLAGASKSSLYGYIFSTMHDGNKIRRASNPLSWKDPSTWRAVDKEASFKVYADDMLGKDGQPGMVDTERVFGANATREAMEKTVRGWFNAFVDNNHLKAEGDDSGGGFGPTSLANKISQSRDIHFRDAKATFDYSQKYGNGSLNKTIQNGIERGARNIGLMQDWGPNPRKTYDDLIQHLLKEHEGNSEAIKGLKSHLLEAVWKNLDGTANIPVNPTIAKFCSFIRTDQHLSKLGGMVIHAVPDMETIATELRKQGMNDMQSHMQPWIDFVSGNDKAARQRAQMSGQAISCVRGHIQSRWGDAPPEFMAKLQSVFNKYSLMDGFDDRNQTPFANFMAKRLGELRDVSMADMEKVDPDHFKQLKAHEITETQWEMYRKTAYRTDPVTGEPTLEKGPGDWHITGDMARILSDEEIASAILKEGKENVTPNNIKRYRNNLDTQLSAYFADRAEIAVPRPGAYEKGAYLNRGMQPGTLQGELWRMMAVYKAFPLTQIRKGLGNQVMGSDSTGTKISNLAQSIVGLTILGYMGFAATDAMQGKVPRSWTDDPGKTLIDSMIKGGGLGLYGDFLFGDFKFGRSAVNQALGPVLGQIDPAIAAWSQGSRYIASGGEEGSDPTPQIFNQVKSNIPFLNLFYARAALNYAILWQLQETIKPGSLRNGEDYMKQGSGQEFFLPPSSVIPRGGLRNEGSYPGEGAVNAVQQITENQ